MAKFNSSTFGTISGRHGTAVASTSKDGQNIIRIYRAPTNPNTAAQVNQRSRFGFVNSELSPLRDIFKTTFRNSRGFNLAVSYALKNAVTGVVPDFTLDYSKLSFAWGSIQLPEQIIAESIESGLKIEWDTTVRKEDEYPDELNVVLMNATSKFTILRESVALRPIGSVTIEIPAIWQGIEIYCWIYFSTPENSLTSVSKYLGKIQL